MSPSNEMNAVIRATMQTVAEESGKEIVSDFGDETVLLQSGLDSLDFAILVARLERELGFDPFSQLDEPVYPKTFADLVDIYVNATPPSPQP